MLARHSTSPSSASAPSASASPVIAASPAVSPSTSGRIPLALRRVPDAQPVQEAHEHESVVETSVRAAARVLGLSDAAVRSLRMPEREMTMKVPFQRANGETGVACGVRVQHNTKRGPAKGGIRYHPGVTLNEVRALAEVMSYKTALLRLPFGGAKGGIAVDPQSLTRQGREDLTRAYVRRLAPILGPHQDVPAPDAGTSAETMAWIVDEYGRLKPPSAAVVTGKPVAEGGLRGRDEATGRGVCVVTGHIMRLLGRPLRGA